jgi:hypothetical protein
MLSLPNLRLAATPTAPSQSPTTTVDPAPLGKEEASNPATPATPTRRGSSLTPPPAPPPPPPTKGHHTPSELHRSSLPNNLDGPNSRPPMPPGARPAAPLPLPSWGLRDLELGALSRLLSPSLPQLEVMMEERLAHLSADDSQGLLQNFFRLKELLGPGSLGHIPEFPGTKDAPDDADKGSSAGATAGSGSDRARRGSKRFSVVGKIKRFGSRLFL